MSEVVAVRTIETPGRRELVDWDRLDGSTVRTYRDVPIVWLREVGYDDYVRWHNEKYDPVSVPADAPGWHYWEVSVD